MADKDKPSITAPSESFEIPINQQANRPPEKPVLFGASPDSNLPSDALSKLAASAAAGRAAYDAVYRGRGPLDAAPSRASEISPAPPPPPSSVSEPIRVDPSSGQPMHPRDRRLYIILTWAAIPAALFAGCFIAWGSGQLPGSWAIAGMLVGVLGMCATTFYALEKKAPSPRYPGPMIIGIAVLTWLLIGWQTWIAFHSPVHGYTQAQLDAAVSTAKVSIQTKLDEALADAKNAKAQLERKSAAAPQPAPSPTTNLGRTSWSNLFNGFTQPGQLQQLSGWWVIITATPENSEAEKELNTLFMIASNLSKTLRLAGLPDYSQDLDAPKLEGKALRGITVHGRNAAADFIAATLSNCFLVLRTAEVPAGLFDYYHRQSSTTFPEDKFVWLEIGNGSPWKGNCRG